MFWGEKIIEGLLETRKDKVSSGSPLIIRDEKTVSGRIHIGSMRSVALHGIVDELLEEKKIKHQFLYEINDFDPMDSVPKYLDQKTFEPYLGKPLFNVPSPDKSFENYAEYFASEFIEVITKKAGFSPNFYRSSEAYKSGKFNEPIEIALKEAPKIRELYKKISKAEKGEDWFPLSVICESCGKIGTTQVTGFDGELVDYICKEDLVVWAKGCGHKGKISPFNGNAKLPWKVEWAAKFKVFDVDLEGAGKDHYTKGGARELSNAICEEVFKRKHPFDVPHEFILVGGKKMSSSKGEGSSAHEVSELLPKQIFRFFLIAKDIRKTLDFDPEGDTVPVLYDNYDKYASKFWEGVGDDESRVFELSHTKDVENLLSKRFLPRFSQIAFLIQMPHLPIKEEVKRLKNEELNSQDEKEIDERSKYAKVWLSKYAPENYKYELRRDSLPKEALSFSEKQKNALKETLKIIEESKTLDGQELHTKLHDLRKSLDIEPKDFFGAIYISFLGKESGPKVGWFLSVLDRDFLLKRLREASI